MSYSFYNLLHIFGIALLVISIGGVCVHAASGGAKETNAVRRLILVMHGLGALLVLVAGFGMLARLDGQESGFPLWIWPKLLIWLVLAGIIVVPYRKATAAKTVVVLVPILVLLSAYFAIYKPF